MNTVIAMVLKTGGIYDHGYVNALANSIKRNTSNRIEIACLTDNSAGFNSNIDTIIPFKHNYPKWWGKIELFRPDLFINHKVLFLDLDTVIINNIDSILELDYDFCALSDFYKIVTLGSGMMLWKGGTCNNIYTNFIEKSGSIMANYLEGDQQWIDENKPRTAKYFQDVTKGIVSFKKHCQKRDGSIVIPQETKIICFHGLPKPHSISDPLIKDHWTPE